MLGPGALTTHLADLGADVIKVEPPQGDYGRRMTWPIVEGVSLLFLHVSRGKRSVVLDLRTEAGCDAFRELVRDADAVVEGDAARWSRPARARLRAAARGQPEDRVRDDLGLRHDRVRTATCRATASRTTCGPASCSRPSTEDGFAVHARARVDRHPRRAAVRRARSARRASLRARETGEGCQLEIAQSDAAAAMDWLRSETWKAYERPGVGGHRERSRQLRAPRTRHRGHGGRRPLPVLRVEGRPRAVHGVGAGVLEELLRRRRPARSVRAVARLAVRRPRARQHRAPRDPARHLRDAHVGRVARVRAASTTRRSRRRTRRRRCSTTRSSTTASR